MRTAALVLFAVSTRVFVPAAGQTAVVDALHVDVLDVQATRWQPPPGISVLHFATVRATEAGETREVTLVASSDRIEVMNDHAMRLFEQPLRISVEPAPSVPIDAHRATRIARTKVSALGWTHTLVAQSCLLVRGTSWEITFPIGSDVSAFVRVDAATGAILEIRKLGGY